MDLFRRRQDIRRKKPTSDGLLAGFLHSVVNIVFYCILNNVAVDSDGQQEIVKEPSASTTSMASQNSNKHVLIDVDTNDQADHRRTDHDPSDSNGLSNHPLPQVNSSSASSVGRLEHVQENQQGKNNRRNLFSWFKKGKKNNKRAEKSEKKNLGSKKQEQVSFTSSFLGLTESASLEIIQLTASPGGARKGNTRLLREPFHGTVQSDLQPQEQSRPGFDGIMSDMDLDSAASSEHLDNKSLGSDKLCDTMATFSLSDVSSFGEREMSDSSSSFTEVASLSSGEVSDWSRLSDGQIPRSFMLILQAQTP